MSKVTRKTVETHTYTVEFTEEQMKLVTAFIGHLGGAYLPKGIHELYRDMKAARGVSHTSIESVLKVSVNDYDQPTFTVKR